MRGILTDICAVVGGKNFCRPRHRGGGRNSSPLAVLMLAWLTACLDPTTTKWQYMPDMADAPTVKAQEDFIDPPPHSVARGAVFYAPTAAESVRTATVARDAAQGKQLYETFCRVCHGAQGKGGGTLEHGYPQPPDISQAVYREHKDAFFFHRITFGTAIMPGYGHAIDVAERWQIVYYLRELQGGQDAR